MKGVKLTPAETINLKKSSLIRVNVALLYIYQLIIYWLMWTSARML